MKSIRLIGVPEHFNYPFRLLAKEQPFRSLGIEIQWKEESRGSGQMIQDLLSNQADLAILLTESFLNANESHANLKMIGFHVASPLIWGIHIARKLEANRPQDLPTPHFLVSRMGSGSHLMAQVLLSKIGNEWKTSPSFEIVGNLDGALEAMENGNKGMFLWEKFTTSPVVKSGQMKRIGDLPSPWPCFVMAVNTDSNSFQEHEILAIRDWIYQMNKTLKSDSNLPQKLAEEYQLGLEEVTEWLKTTRWATEADFSKSVLEETFTQITELGITKRKLNAKEVILNNCFRLV